MRHSRSRGRVHNKDRSRAGRCLRISTRGLSFRSCAAKPSHSSIGVPLHIETWVITMLFSARMIGLLLLVLMAGGCAAFHGNPAAPNIIRQPLEVDDPAFPVAGGVMTRAGTDTVYLAGLLPTVVNLNAPKDSVEAY